ncbi:MAG: hypothetical protein P8L44_07115 [Opitutales bacterium]|nr:hypothetical protein [Opitutales bacterium]MDG2167681.1 hypothetical protein [Opitutales bacterium]
MSLLNPKEIGLSSDRSDVSSDLWAITCYFNPCNYRNRRNGYETFRKHLQVPLLTVELSFTGEFHLNDGDADKLIRLTSSDVMWQKERLLNLAVEALPDSCDKVCWIDCDIVFGNNDWPQLAREALERHQVIQPFQFSYDLEPGMSGPEFSEASYSRRCESLVSLYLRGGLPEDHIKIPDKRAIGITPGYAWAARRDLLLKHTLYDPCIVGGGDGPILTGFFGNFQDIIEYLSMNPRRVEHFMEWAEAIYQDVSGDVGYIPVSIYHLWHGEIENLNYKQRRMELERHAFDPYEDIAIASNGCWRIKPNQRSGIGFESVEIQGFWGSTNIPFDNFYLLLLLEEQLPLNSPNFSLWS